MSANPVYVESIGEGRQLVFFHGWGMHGGVFNPVVDELRDGFNVLLVDLPGHGYSDPFDRFHLIDACSEYLLDQIGELLADKAVLIGWSTGSLIAQHIAVHYPELVEKLVLITGTPCFENKPDWVNGVASGVLEQFRNNLIENFEKTLNRFLALQFIHSDDQKENLRIARQLVFSRQTPDLEMLKAGLALLQSTDLRANLAAISCETLVLNGERDSLVPTTAARYLAENISVAQSVIFKSAGHAPFLSHKKLFNQSLKQFLS